MIAFLTGMDSLMICPGANCSSSNSIYPFTFRFLEPEGEGETVPPVDETQGKQAFSIQKDTL